MSLQGRLQAREEAHEEAREEAKRRGPEVARVLLAVLAGPRSSCVAETPPRSSSAAPDADATNAVPDDRFSDAFFQCYADAKQRDGDAASTLPCVGEGARVGLESFFSKRNLLLSEGLSLVQEDAEAGEGRETPLPFPQELPPLFDGHQRSVIDSAAAYLSARALRWDMSGLYPGLIMRVGPTLSGNGWLEFVLEPRRVYTNRELGPSRTVLKQVVLPFLLGLKVSVASLVPLLLFAIVFLAKKALLMSQLSALVSGVLGFGAYGGPAYGGYGHPHAFGGGFDGGGLAPNSPFNNPLAPVRTSPQVFPNSQRVPPPVEEGPQILTLGSTPLAGTLPLPGAAPALPSWLTGSATPHHLFRKVNYDFRDERHAATGHRNTKGFRWEDEPAGQADDGDPRSADEQRRSNTIRGTLSLG
ncbi:uncharacterized protein LOC117653094 [Thrips palmi]|uniref:Uncharacterized protein LOC117653094 n=1 Tax=Thrips palmi TaxID=161013 RepID=A0A6P9A8J5_THRPL|nr:uncharacterized protein LOC117653094 [Thrips palmi]